VKAGDVALQQALIDTLAKLHQGPDERQGREDAPQASEAETTGTDPRIPVIQELFPAVDLAVIKSILENKFAPENLLKLDNSFLPNEKLEQHKKKSATIKINNVDFTTDAADFEARDYSGIVDLIYPFEIYGQILVQLVPDHEKSPLQTALMLHRTRLFELSRNHTWHSVRTFHLSFHRKVIRLGPLVPGHWQTRDHGLETQLLVKHLHLSLNTRKRTHDDFTASSRAPTTNYSPNQFPSSSYNPGTNHNPSRFSSNCKKWNSTGCLYRSCRWRHACSSCDKEDHSETNCPAKRS